MQHFEVLPLVLLTVFVFSRFYYYDIIICFLQFGTYNWDDSLRNNLYSAWTACLRKFWSQRRILETHAQYVFHCFSGGSLSFLAQNASTRTPIGKTVAREGTQSDEGVLSVFAHHSVGEFPNLFNINISKVECITSSAGTGTRCFPS